jgi:TRAP transporter TAXI family solute receptor
MRIRFSLFMPVPLTLLTMAILLLQPTAAPAFSQPSLVISTGNSTGTYYAVSNALAKIFNRKSADYGVRLTTVASQGSVANIYGVTEGKTAFGISESLMLQFAENGTGPWKGKPDTRLRAVLGLHVEAMTIVAAVDPDIRRIGDLKGKRVNIGAPGSSDYEYGELFLERAGVNPTDVILSTSPAALASELLQKKDIDAFIYTVGHPNLSVLEASSGKRKVLLVPLDTPLITRITGANPLLVPTVIPTDYYPGLECRGPVPSIGVRAVLFTRDDTPDETVYRLVREVMTNFDLLKRQHPVLRGLTPREAAEVTAIPLHPGAERYFREAGLGN